MWRSVPQTEVASTRTSACPFPGRGAGTSSSRSPGPGSALMRACMVFTRSLYTGGGRGVGCSGVQAFRGARILVLVFVVVLLECRKSDFDFDFDAGPGHLNTLRRIHVAPVAADLYVHFERNGQLHGGGHAASDEGGE